MISYFIELEKELDGKELPSKKERAEEFESNLSFV